MNQAAASTSPNYIIYSDGGSQNSRGAAGACVIDDLEAGRRRCLVIYLGTATNNEAEISGAVLAFSYLTLLAEQSELPGRRLRWVCDSEYVLKSATGYIWNWQRNGWRTASREPVKNQGLWRAYLRMSKGYEIVPEHVRGHTGHPENELCDAACNAVIAEGAEVFEIGIKPGYQELPGVDGRWLVLDGRELIAALRSENPAAEALDGFKALLADAPTAAGEESPGPAPSPTTQDPPRAVMTKLKALAQEAARAGTPRARELSKAIEALLERYKP